MKNFGIFLSATLLVVACSGDKSNQQTEEAGIEKITLSSSMIHVNSADGFALHGSAQVSKASISCPWWAAGEEITFGSEPVSIYRDGRDLSSGIFSSCTVRLEEFTAEGNTYQRSNTIVPLLLANFDAEDNGDLIDRKKVLFFQQPFVSPDACSPEAADNCNYYTVNFTYSELDSDLIDLDNSVVINKVDLHVSAQEAPSCDVSAKWNLGGSLAAPPSLTVSMTSCQNTIGTGYIRWGFGPKDGSAPFLIDDIFALINSGDVRGNFAGSGASFTLSLQEVIDMLPAGSSDVTALNTDFILGIKNLGGISAAYFLIEND